MTTTTINLPDHGPVLVGDDDCTCRAGITDPDCICLPDEAPVYVPDPDGSADYDVHLLADALDEAVAAYQARRAVPAWAAA